MEITSKSIYQKLVVKAKGRIDALTAVEYGTKINDLLDDNDIEIKELILDFSEIDYISSLGLRVMLELQRRMNNQGAMKLINVAPSVVEVFKTTGFTKILTIE